MSLQFNPGGMGAARLFEHTAESIRHVDPEPSAEEINRRNYQWTHRHQTLRAPGPECELCIDGQRYVSRPHPRHGFVWDLPSAKVNEFIHGHEINLGGGNWMRLNFAP